MWSPKLDYNDYDNIIRGNSLEGPYPRYRDFIDKNISLNRAPIIESLRISFYHGILRPDDLRSWVGIAISRFVREISINFFSFVPDVSLLSSLYTCKSLVTLKLSGHKTIVDVPGMVCLPSLKTLQLLSVRYSNQESLPPLLSHCPVLEDQTIERYYTDNVRDLVVIVPTLKRLSLYIPYDDSFKRCVIVTPSLRYFKFRDIRDGDISHLVEHMPELEDAEIIDVKLLKSVTYVKHLSFTLYNNAEITVYPDAISFNQLESLKLDIICKDNWSQLLVQLLKDSPKLQALHLNLQFQEEYLRYEAYDGPVSWSNNDESSIPKSLLKNLKTFELKGYKGNLEERDFLSFISKHAAHVKSSILHQSSP